MKLKIGDFLLVVVLVFLAFKSFNLNYNKKDLKVEIISPYEKKFINLIGNRSFKVKGYKGFLVVEIKNRKVRVIKSTCKNKICIKTGWISKKGDSIICVPNKIIIKIVGTSEKKRDKIDFITR